MLIVVGLSLLAGAIALMRGALVLQRGGGRFWANLTASEWFALLFTGILGLGFICALAGVIQLFGA